MDKIIEKIEALRKEILNDKNVNVFDKGLYCVELMDIRLELEELELEELELEELELKSDLLNSVSETEFIERLENEEDFADKYLESVNYPKDLIEKGTKEVAKIIEEAKKKHSR